MVRQYDRRYDLTITSEDGESRVIKDLRINFEITKSNLSFPNLARIALYNPNKETLALLQRRFTKLTLNAGYFGDVKLLFKGEIRNVFQKKVAQDRVVTVYAGDGEKAWQNSIFNKTFTDNITISQAIQDVLDSFEDITIGVVNGLPQVADKLRGQTLSGSSKDILDDFAKEYGFDWSIQDGEINIVPVNDILQSNEAVLITATTGMIGTPSITEIGADVTTLLNPRLIPNRAFKIESVSSEVSIGNLFFRQIPRTSAEGTYKILESTFKGDSREGDWLSMVKGVIIND